MGGLPLLTDQLKWYFIERIANAPLESPILMEIIFRPIFLFELKLIYKNLDASV